MSEWTATEDDTLRRRWRAGEWDEALLDLLPGRNRLSIQRRATTIGLTRPMESSALPWQRAENDILRAHYAHEGSAVSVRLPGRSERACRQQARRIGLQYDRAAAIRSADGKFA